MEFEKPIIFNAEMVRAIINGKKNVTRRIIKAQPVNPKWSGSEWIDTGCDDTKHFALKCPYKVGMRLWVRESWCVHQLYDAIPPRILPEAEYLQNGITYLADVYNSEKSLWMGETRPSIFMPRKLSRINLEITDIRVERIQDITEADAIAEGIGQRLGSSAMGHTFTAIEHFRALWDSINKKRGHGRAENPFCWCVSFRKVT